MNPDRDLRLSQWAALVDAERKLESVQAENARLRETFAAALEAMTVLHADAHQMGRNARRHCDLCRVLDKSRAFLGESTT